MVQHSCKASRTLLQTLRTRGCGSMVERGLPKPETRVRFPSPAPISIKHLRRSASEVQLNRQPKVCFFCGANPKSLGAFPEARSGFPALAQAVAGFFERRRIYN